MIFVSISLSLILTSIDLGGIGVIAPTISSDLNGGDFTWVGSAYLLASSACLPLSGNLAHIFGRRPILLAAIAIFAAGSLACALAKSMNILIVGRAIQGIGGGGIQALSFIIVSDLVSLSERGLYNGILSVVIAMGSGVAPFIAGSFADHISWRWFFWINLPLCAVSFVWAAIFLNLNGPEGSLLAKLANIDWLGNFLLTASTSSTLIALTWGGVRYAWMSYNVLVPLIVGVIGLLFAFWYEYKWASQPTIPMSILLNGHSFNGYLGTFVHGIVLGTFSLDILANHVARPAWFQAIHEATPTKSGLLLLPMVAGVLPCAIIGGVVVARVGRYYISNLVGWCCMLIGLGLLVSIKKETHYYLIAIYEVIFGCGVGLLYAVIIFAVLAPLTVAQQAPAMALLTFFRTFSQAWGITIGGAVLQDGLRKRLPQGVMSKVPSGQSLAFALIPHIPTLEAQVREEVQMAFHQSMHRVWVVTLCIGSAGMLTMVFMRNLPLKTTTDERWGIAGKGSTVEDDKSSLHSPSIVHTDDGSIRSETV
ncbi:iron permease [Cylindrobasidium torrendii FP15055 ss-10]|uniref:Iron permease n=1 Tax=Cylindrobasidium torrendii FP15055 ss-10 TaxID=1314674 RepID=A0A0D7BPP2_9AGAR|nr:iron permease [Cylindrobasidium torrendii FP15055 ss-10]